MRKCYFLLFNGELSVFKKMFLKAAVLFFALLSFSVGESSAQGPGAQWEFSRDITFSTATPLADFQVKIELNDAAQHAHMKVDGGDLRFYVGSVECAHWIERFNPNGLSVIWVKIPANGTTGLTMYYGNPAALTTSDGYMTFDLFDGFEGSTLKAIWNDNSTITSPSGTVSVEDNKVKLKSSGTGGSAKTSIYTDYSTILLPDSYIVELKHKETGYYRNRFYVSNVYSSNNSAPAPIPDYGIWSDDNTASPYGAAQWSGTRYNSEQFLSGVDYLMKWDITKGSKYNWSNYIYNTNDLIGLHTGNTTAPLKYLIFSITELKTQGSLNIDWVRIRKDHSTKVIADVGTEVGRLDTPVITGVSPTTGCEGTQFTITGTFPSNFNDRLVIIAGDTLEIISQNVLEIIAKFGPESGAVKVITGSGSVVGSSVTVSPLPVVDAGPNLGERCQGSTTVPLGGNVDNINPGSAVWTVDITGGTFNPGTDYKTTTWTPPAGFSGKAIFTLTGTNTCGSRNDTTSVMYNPKPTGTVSISSTSACVGGVPITFTAPSGYLKYTFLVNGIPINTGNNIFSPSNLQPGDIVRVRIETTKECFDTLDVPAFTVHPFPNGIFNYREASGVENDGKICIGAIASFSYTTASSSDNYRFILIRSGDSSILHQGIGVANSYVDVDTLKNGDQVVLEVTGAGGCKKMFGPELVTVHPNPVGILMSSATNNSICAGENITFTATPGFLNYEFLNGSTSVLNSASNLYGPVNAVLGGEKISVRVKDSVGCFAIIDTVEVIVHALPVKPAISIGSQATTFCEGGSRNIILTATGAAGESYQWYKDGVTYGPITTANTLTLSVASESGKYKVQLKNANGCYGPLSDETEILIHPTVETPVVTASGPLNFCVGGSRQVVLTSSAANSYQWYRGPNAGSLSAIAGQTGQTLTLTDVAQTDYYAVGVTNINNCAGASLSEPLLVTVNALPSTPTITFGSGNLEHCEDESVTLSAPLSSSYKWFLNNVEITGATSQNYTTPTTLASAGTYTVMVTNAKGCFSTVSAGITVVINPLPLPTIDNGIICLGSVGDYTTEPGKENYIWSLDGDGAINSGQGSNSINVTWGTNPGAKSLNVKYTDDKGCTSISQAVFANLPALIPVISGAQTVCVDSTRTYTTQSGNGESDYTWEFSNGVEISGGTATDPTIAIKWTVPGAQSVSVNYTKAGCSAASPTIWPVTVKPLPVGKFSYDATPYCSSGSNPLPEMVTGAIIGVFSSSAGLSINSSTGEVNLSASTPGTYKVYNTIASAGGCGSVKDSTEITITKLPTATITYPESPFCTTEAGPKVVSFSGTSGAYEGGIFSASAGLSIDAVSGAITPSSSTKGNYTVIYTIPASDGCGVVTVNTVPFAVVITDPPVLNFSYNKTEYCISDGSAKNPSFTGSTGAYKNGTYSVVPTVGLAVDANGRFTPSASGNIAGTYTITYSTKDTLGCGPVNKDFTVTITPIPTASISYGGTPFCKTTTSAGVTLTGDGPYLGGVFSSTAGLVINSATGSINPSTSSPGSYTVTYKTSAAGVCSVVSADTSVTITDVPAINAGSDVATCVGGGAVNITLGSGVNNGGQPTWSGGIGTWTNIHSLTAATYEPAPSETGNIILTLSTPGVGGCASTTFTSTKTLTINTLPAPVHIVPETTPKNCVGSIQPFISVENDVTAGTFGPVNSTGGVVSIPDNATIGIAKTINVTGIDVNAVITSVEIKFNITHPSNGDLTINLKAPNGKVLNIANALSGAGFSNTIISSTSSNPIQTSEDTGPFNGTYGAQMRYGAQGATVANPNRAFAKSFSELFGVANGNWILSVRDGGLGDLGTMGEWSITINYSIPLNPIPVTWRTLANTIPDNLYIDPAATILYTGDAREVVYAKPDATGTYNYRATSTAPTSCSTFKDIQLVVDPSPKVFIKANYCNNAVNGKVTLTAESENPLDPNFVSYNWSTGDNTKEVLVDIANEYYVSVTNTEGCIATGVLSVAQELVVNGDFEAPFDPNNPGFVTDYTWMPSPTPPSPTTGNSGLRLEGTYAIDTVAHMYHTLFYGRDHTTSEQKGKFMIINGGDKKIGNPPRYLTIWEQTVDVLPNTDYYFSAWAMNVNKSGPFPMLQFEVNGQPVGTIADLKQAPKPINESQVSINNWVRFYNGNLNGVDQTWNSGENTTAVIRIINLNTSNGGNDFGLDDISFGTLAPFVSGPDVPGRNSQIVCTDESILPILYKVGSGDKPELDIPSTQFTTTWDGYNFTINGASAAPGNYDYILRTTGECPTQSVAIGTITVLPDPKFTLTSAGTTDRELCFGTNLQDAIQFSLTATGPGGSVTGTDFSGLPAGMSGAYNNGAPVITGAASEAGIFEYKIRTVGLCKKDSISGTISIDTKPTLTSISTPTVCIGGDGVVKAEGITGQLKKWETSTDGITWTDPGNIINPQSFTNIQTNTFYKATISNGVCPDFVSNAVPVQISNLWEGKVGNNWNISANWSSGNLPNISSCGGTVTIPKVSTGNLDPILVTNTTSSLVKNLNILSGGKLTINPGGNLQLEGTIMNAGILDARNGGIEYVGNTARTIEPNIFLNNAIGDLKISNSNNSEVTLNTPIDIYRSLTFGPNGKKLNTNDQLTIKSTKEETAWVGNMTGKIIDGKVTVERFINTGLTAEGGHRKSWQLLATPTQGQSIKDSWMEGATASNIPTNPSTSTESQRNPNRGFGTMITSAVPNAANQPTPGFDARTAPGPSMKTYNPATNTYDAGPATTSQEIYNPKGYLVLVRGDRSVYTHNAPANPTTLRTKGTLLTGTQPVMNFAPNTWNSVGNPYASAIDFNKVTRTGGAGEILAVWDPETTGDYGLGAFTYLTRQDDGSYIATPPSYSYITDEAIHIQSGQAFMVQTAPTLSGSIQFTENAKVSGSRMVMRGQRGDNRISQLRANLYGLDKNDSATISDGILLQFAEDLSNEIDGKDARKMSNTSENLSIISNGIHLAVERRQPLQSIDTIFLNLSGVRVQDYRFELKATGMQSEGLHGYFEDLYLGTSTPLNLEGTIIVNFSIENKPLSYAPNRFRIVFKSALGPLPVTFTGINAGQVKEDILVTWNVENEINTLGYDVEKSIDGVSFTKLFHAPSRNIKTYHWLDKDVQAGNHYYRVKALNAEGKTEVTSIVKVQVQSDPAKITVYPNPITNGIVNVHLINQPSGKYKIRLLNPVGQVIENKIVTHVQGNSIHPIDWDYKQARGMYQIEVTKPDGGVNIIKVVY